MFVKSLKANESLTSLDVQTRSHLTLGRVIVWKTFWRSPINEQVFRSITIPTAAAIFPYVSADQVTFFALLAAFLTFPFLKSKNVCYRWIGFGMLVLREILDDLDGDVARAYRANLYHYPFLTSPSFPSSSFSSSSSSSTSVSSKPTPYSVLSLGYAYFLDGICDSVFFFLFLIICFLKWRAKKTSIKDSHDDGTNDVRRDMRNDVGDDARNSIENGVEGDVSSGSCLQNEVTRVGKEGRDDDDVVDQKYISDSGGKVILKGSDVTWESDDVVRKNAGDGDVNDDIDDDDDDVYHDNKDAEHDESRLLPLIDEGDDRRDFNADGSSFGAEGQFVRRPQRRSSSFCLRLRRLRHRLDFHPRYRHLPVLVEYLVTFLLQSYCFNSSLQMYTRTFNRLTKMMATATATTTATTTATAILQSKSFFVISHLWMICDPSIIFMAAAFSLCVDKELQFCRFGSRRVFLFAVVTYVISLIHLQPIDSRTQLS